MNRATRRLVSIAIAAAAAIGCADTSAPKITSVDPSTVLVHDRQTELIRVLEARQFTVVPVRMRHCYTMLGGLHCTTLDVVRDSVL